MSYLTSTDNLVVIPVAQVEAPALQDPIAQNAPSVAGPYHVLSKGTADPGFNNAVILLGLFGLWFFRKRIF